MEKLFSKLKVAIIEDQKNLAIELSSKLTKVGIGNIDIIIEEEPISHLNKIENYDFIFIDFIRVGQTKTNLLIKQIQELNSNIRIIVYSSYYTKSNYNELADLNILAFVPRDSDSLFFESLIKFNLKYLSDEDSTNVPADIKRVVNFSRQHLMVKVGAFYKKINIRDVSHAEIDGKYSMLYVGKEKYLIRASLKRLLEIYPNILVRVHGKYVINIEKLVKIDYKNKRIFLDEHKVLLSRNYRNDLYSLLGINLKTLAE